MSQKAARRKIDGSFSPFGKADCGCAGKAKVRRRAMIRMGGLGGSSVVGLFLR